ncbi:MAG TPA: DUF4276 family protein [Candidatus Angelobacter sp.]|nr:DUF4276 family protein [Candidatus Angelobacter sp.]
MSTKIYVEGGGNQQRTVKACRIAFSKYFEKVLPNGVKPRIVVCGSGPKAFEDFKNSLGDPNYQRILLLVDSETEVADGKTAWDHLHKLHKWVKPLGTNEDSAQMMVQCMESWFLADKDCLQRFFGQRFKANALPSRKEVERISKKDVIAGLERATKHTQKGAYHKTRHGFDILAAIDPQKVEAVSPFASRLHICVRK